MPFEILLELGHGHLISGLGRLLSAWRGHGGGLSLGGGALGRNFTCNSLLRSLLSGGGLVRCVFKYFFD